MALESLVEFYEADRETLFAIQQVAGKGSRGKHETFLISMASYMLQQSMRYMEKIVDNFERDPEEAGYTLWDDDWEKPTVKELPMVSQSTLIENQAAEIVRLADNVLKTTQEKKVYSSYSSTNPTKAEVRELVEEILIDVPDEESNRPGFTGWLVAEATSRLSVKVDPKKILDLVLDMQNGTDVEGDDEVPVTITTISSTDYYRFPKLGERFGPWKIKSIMYPPGVDAKDREVMVEHVDQGITSKFKYRDLMERYGA